MNSKRVLLLVVALTLIILILGWIFLKDVMMKFDVDRDTSQAEFSLDFRAPSI